MEYIKIFEDFVNEGKVKQFMMFKSEVEKVIGTSLPDDEETNEKLLNCFQRNVSAEKCAKQFKIEDKK